MPTKIRRNVKLVLGDAGHEETLLKAMVERVLVARRPLFLGRFLSDLTVPAELLMEWNATNVVVRQYGPSCRMNACPQLAEAGRIDLGIEEAEAVLRSGRYPTVLLSQVLTAVEEELMTPEDIVSLMDACPEHVALVLTGRTAPTQIAAQCEPWAEEDTL